MRLAHQLRGSGIPIVHYVAPQLWAWRPGRAKKLGRRVNHIMALLPFEASFFAKYDIPSTYVGHPAIETGVDRGDGPAFRARHGLPADATVLCVLPGSRNGEVRRLIPVYRRGSAHPQQQPTRTSASSSRWPMPRPKPCAQ